MLIKILLIFILSFPAIALELRKQGEYFYFRFQDNGVLYCWGLYQFTDLAYINDVWTTVQQTVIDRSWPAADERSIAVCNEPREVWRTRAWTIDGRSPVYAVQSIPPKMNIIGYLPDGMICGDRVTQFQYSTFEYRQVNYAAATGIAICTKRIE